MVGPAAIWKKRCRSTFKIKNSKIQAVGALALIMHASEMADGNHWQKVIARAAIEQFGPADYGGVLALDDER